jgi:hypothetical protein
VILPEKMIPYQQSSHNMRGEASGSTVSSYILDVSSLSLADDELNVCFVYCDDCHSLTRTVSDSGNEYLGGVAACEVCGALREIGTVIGCGPSSHVDGKSKL